VPIKFLEGLVPLFPLNFQNGGPVIFCEEILICANDGITASPKQAIIKTDFVFIIKSFCDEKFIMILEW
jgi:hypothetical protein